MAPIRRMTLFTTNTDADVGYFTEKFSSMQQDAKKDGKPYILSITAGRTTGDPRNKGVTFAAICTFASLEDMQYYDDSDVAHGALKAGGKGRLAGPPMVVYFEEVVGSGL